MLPLNRCAFSIRGNVKTAVHCPHLPNGPDLIARLNLAQVQSADLQRDESKCLWPLWHRPSSDGDSLNINRAAAKLENTTETSMNGNEYEPAVKKMILAKGEKRFRFV